MGEVEDEYPEQVTPTSQTPNTLRGAADLTSAFSLLSPRFRMQDPGDPAAKRGENCGEGGRRVQLRLLFFLGSQKRSDLHSGTGATYRTRGSPGLAARRGLDSPVCQLRSAAATTNIHAAISAIFLGRRACPAAALGLRVLSSRPPDEGAEAEAEGTGGNSAAAATVAAMLVARESELGDVLVRATALSYTCCLYRCNVLQVAAADTSL